MMAGRIVLKWVAGVCAAAFFSRGIAAAEMPLRIYAVDVEGGAATLYVTPQGHSLLIDTGWPTGMGGPHVEPGAPLPPPTPDSAQRIVAVMRSAGVARIDDLLISHYHADHVGGAAELMGLVPVGAVYDHGPNRQPNPPGADPARLKGAPATLYPGYIAAIGDRPHHVLHPGDTLRLDDLVISVVDSDGSVRRTPLHSGGALPSCPSATSKDVPDGDENPRSVGVVMRWGKARILSLADTTWNVENSIVCPRDMVGPVDLMFADNHGSDNANSPVLVNAVRPRVVVFANGPTKGEDTASLDAFEKSPRIQGIWQLHFAQLHPDRNAPAAQIANLRGGNDAMYPVQLSISRNGTVIVTNPRTGVSTSYR